MRRLIFLIVTLLALTPFISAYTYLNIYIDETGEALFLGETNEQLNLPEGVGIDKETISGTTQKLTEKKGENWKFLYNLEGAELYIILPKGAVIKNIGDGEITLEKNQLSVYAKENIEIEYIIEKNEGLNYWLFLLVVLIIVVFSYFYMSVFKEKKKVTQTLKKKDGVRRINKKEKLEVMKQILSDREKIIVDKLGELKEIKHSQLQKILEIPKASFSRHIQELERKNIIKRTGEGKNKIISLK